MQHLTCAPHATGSPMVRTMEHMGTLSLLHVMEIFLSDSCSELPTRDLLLSREYVISSILSIYQMQDTNSVISIQSDKNSRRKCSCEPYRIFNEWRHREIIMDSTQSHISSRNPEIWGHYDTKASSLAMPETSKTCSPCVWRRQHYLRPSTPLWILDKMRVKKKIWGRGLVGES